MKTLARSSRALIREFKIDLTGHNVLTEAATGAFSTTASMAALAGANVFAIAKASRFGSLRQARLETSRLARFLGVSNRIQIVSSLRSVPVSQIDIVTNCGFVRPIARKWIQKLSPHAVVTLMMEPWEVRSSDVDITALLKRGIASAGVNEHGRKVNVFSFLTPLLQRELRIGEEVFLRTTDEFSSYLRRAVKLAGAKETREVSKANVFVIAIGPKGRITRHALRSFPSRGRIIQLWGDIEGARSPRWRWIPAFRPTKGHMGLRLDDLGPESAIRLLAAGLKVGELLANARVTGMSPRKSIKFAVRSGFALPIGQ